jgi:predicted Fe-Mo cluster-binding NifX family protein
MIIALTRAAIPVFRKRVSPVFDSCSRILLVDIEKGREVDRKEIYLDALPVTERVMILRKFQVGAVICGGISSLLENMLISAKIDLISDISGEIDTVLEAYRAKKLDRPRFHMPGRRTDSHDKDMDREEQDHESR